MLPIGVVCRHPFLFCSSVKLAVRQISSTRYNRIGKRYSVQCAPFVLSGGELKFVSEMKYLGVCVMAARCFKTSVSHLKIKFYRAFNCIYSRSKAANSEMVAVELLIAYCLPLLLYASESVSHS